MQIGCEGIPWSQKRDDLLIKDFLFTHYFLVVYSPNFLVCKTQLPAAETAVNSATETVCTIGKSQGSYH